MQDHAFPERRVYNDPSFPVSCWEGSQLQYVAHWHGEVELLYILQGRMRVSVNRQCQELGPGDLALIGSGEIHYYEGPDPECRYMILIFAPELTGQPSGWPRRKGPHASVIRGTDGRPDAGWKEITELMKVVLREAAGKQTAWKGMVRAALWELTARAERMLPADAAHSGDGRFGETHDRMQKALNYIYLHCLKPVRLTDVAKTASMSPSHFSRTFSRYTGQNLNSYVNCLRIKRAKELLERTESIVDIAYESGFDSVRNFNRAFKKAESVTPREYRRLLASRP